MKRMYKVIPVILCIGLLLYGCLDDPGLPEGIVNGGVPVIESDSIIATRANSIEARAVISKHKGSPATRYGFYVRKESGGENRACTAAIAPLVNGKIEFTVLVNDLEPHTAYIIRAFAVNEAGEGLGVELKRTTTSGLGQITTIKPDSIKGTSVVAGGNMVEPGEGTILERGLFRSRRPDMSLKDTLISPMNTDSFVFKVAGLDTMTTYYLQAFARNDYGVFTGDPEEFTTKNGRPEFESFSILGWEFTDASYAATLLSEGDAPVTSKGVCWSETPGPTIDNHVSVNPSGNLNFTGTISGLTPLTKYYVRAFAVNSPFGTTYSQTIEFTTRNNQPVVESNAIFSISDGSAGVEGEVLSAGMGAITVAGFCWSTSPDPTILNSYKVMSNSVGPFRDYISGLRGGRTYYVRAFAQNSSGQTAYGRVLTMDTPPVFTSMADFPGEPRIPNSSASFVIGNMAYLVGGDKGLVYTNELWAYSSSDQWNPVASFPGTARKWQTAIVSNDVAYLFGGIDASNNRSNEVHSYLPNQNRWETIATTNTPDPIHSSVGIATGSAACFIGGCRDTVTNEVWSFNIFSHHWEAKTPLPEKQYGGIAVTINGVVYAGLGLNNTSGTSSHKRLWSTTSFNSWTEETPLSASAGHVRGGVAYKGAIYIVDNTGAIWKYDIVEKAWTKKSTLPSSNIGDSQHCMFVLNNMIYIGLGVSRKSLLKYDPVWDN
jgi:N-acetylneuraminic acid mutarotase